MPRYVMIVDCEVRTVGGAILLLLPYLDRALSSSVQNRWNGDFIDSELGPVRLHDQGLHGNRSESATRPDPS